MECGYFVVEVFDCLGVFVYSFYKWLWVIKFDNSEQYVWDLLEVKSEILKFWVQLKCIEEEWDILKKVVWYFVREFD